MTKNCAVILGNNFREVSENLNLARGRAEAFEFRLDTYSDEDFSFLNEELTTIVTVKNSSEKFSEKIYEEALASGATYLDIDVSSSLLTTFSKKNLIISFHDFEKSFDSEKILEKIFEMKRFGIPKFVCTPNSPKDLLEIAKASEVLKNSSEKFILIGAGEVGKVTRLRSESLGSYFNYCALSKNFSTAAGQLTLSEAEFLGKNPIITGVVGWPLTTTNSPQIHNAAFRAANISGYYLKLPCPPEELPLIPDVIRKYKIAGVNVTIPYKESILPYLADIEPLAKTAGAVNTIRSGGQNLIGFNTDIVGFSESLKQTGAEVSDAKILLIGAGGAARAALSYLRKHNARVTIFSRTKERAETLGKKFCAKVSKENFSEEKWDIIINASSAGMRGFENSSPVPALVFSKDTIVMDMVYDPEETEFLRLAKLSGVKKTINGGEMLIKQAAASFVLWTGVEPDVTIMEKAFGDEE